MSETKKISDHAAVAKLLKAFCKTKGVKIRVRSEAYSGGTSVTVNMVDQSPATLEEIKSEASQYKYGHFDGMTDSYEYSNSRKDIPQVKFLFVENRMSDEMRAKIYHYCKSNFAGMEEAPADHTEANHFYNKAYDCHADSLMWRIFNGCDGDFWTQQAAA
jgi:hypothetical protein